MSLPHRLTGLTTREAITDTIYRGTQAFDENDFGLLSSAFSEDASFEMRGYTITGLNNVKSQVFDAVGPMVTTHTVGNVRIEIENDEATEAKATAKAIAHHFPRGTALGSGVTGWVVGVKYYVEVVKQDDGLWKARKFVVDTVWGEGNPEVMKG